jgi:hypothetical protein
MSLPIKETPVLRGKDAINFLKRMDEVDRGMHPISKKEYDRAKKVYDKCTAAWGKLR